MTRTNASSPAHYRQLQQASADLLAALWREHPRILATLTGDKRRARRALGGSQ